MFCLTRDNSCVAYYIQPSLLNDSLRESLFAEDIFLCRERIDTCGREIFQIAEHKQITEQHVTSLDLLCGIRIPLYNSKKKILIIRSLI